MATDCRGCFYTIRADDPEGMLLVEGEHYCIEACYHEHQASLLDASERRRTDSANEIH